MRDRGQSEVVGFVLVFGTIVLALAVVSATGYAGLEGARDFERTNNAERGMTLLAENVDDVTRGAPSRVTELKLADATLALEDPVTITVSGERVGDPTENFTRTTSVRPIVYDTGTGATVVYVDGALIREVDHGAVMVREPGLVLTNETAVVPIVRTDTPRNRSVGGSTTVRVRTEDAGSEVIRTGTTQYDLTLSITSPRTDAWYRYLESQPATDCSRSGTTVSCTATARRVSVSVDHVRVRFT